MQSTLTHAHTPHSFLATLSSKYALNGAQPVPATHILETAVRYLGCSPGPTMMTWLSCPTGKRRLPGTTHRGTLGVAGSKGTSWESHVEHTPLRGRASCKCVSPNSLTLLTLCIAVLYATTAIAICNSPPCSWRDEELTHTHTYTHTHTQPSWRRRWRRLWAGGMGSGQTGMGKERSWLWQGSPAGPGQMGNNWPLGQDTVNGQANSYKFANHLINPLTSVMVLRGLVQ